MILKSNKSNKFSKRQINSYNDSYSHRQFLKKSGPISRIRYHLIKMMVVPWKQLKQLATQCDS